MALGCVPLRDPATDASLTLDYAHHELHSGSMYKAQYHAQIGAGSNLDILIIVPNTAKWPHAAMSFAGEFETEAIFYEGTTTSANGTSVPAINKNRNSTNTAGVTVFHTPTVTGVGTAIDGAIVGSGRSYGGEARDQSEYILKQNTKYLIRMTNNGTNTGYISFRVDWYEHTSIA